MRRITPDQLPGPALAKEVLARFCQEARRLGGKRLRQVIVYGSMARGDAGPESDLDLWIDWDGDEAEGWDLLGQLAAELFLESGQIVSVHVVGPQHAQRMQAGGSPFLRCRPFGGRACRRINALMGMARDSLRAARMETEAGLERNAIASAYFAAYQAARALLASKGMQKSSRPAAKRHVERHEQPPPLGDLWPSWFVVHRGVLVRLRDLFGPRLSPAVHPWLARLQDLRESSQRRPRRRKAAGRVKAMPRGQTPMAQS